MLNLTAALIAKEIENHLVFFPGRWERDDSVKTIAPPYARFTNWKQRDESKVGFETSTGITMFALKQCLDEYNRLRAALTPDDFARSTAPRLPKADR